VSGNTSFKSSFDNKNLINEVNLCCQSITKLAQSFLVNKNNWGIGNQFQTESTNFSAFSSSQTYDL